MSEQEFKRALGYAAAAIELLKRSEIPPYPQFYELMFAYATGVDPGLNTRINALLRNDIKIDLAERLYDEFLKSNDTQDHISSVSERMSDRISTMHDAIDTAMSTATAYSSALQIASGDLEDEIDREGLRAMTASLLNETRRMQTANHELESNLEEARKDISELRRDLDNMRNEAMLDPLTQLFNRKAFDDGMMRMLMEARESNKPLCLLLIDIDHFKRFNDTWGHQTGDQVLRLVASTIKSNITEGQDIGARYGGEEFAVILPGTNLHSAIRLAETIRKAVRAKELLKRSTNEKLGRITASIGIAVFDAEADSSNSLIERADLCLYAAKKSGRNRIVDEQQIGPDGNLVAA
ncbi:GGDEF domain-containing protein [Devosia sp.]|uniref:GGDEF domain-containing protein n=1 Tax=Devosia sp. TaxID=1871048 RepID=UPI003A9204F0